MSKTKKWFAIGGATLIALVIIGSVLPEPEPKTMAQPSTTTTQETTTTTTQPPATTTTVQATTTTTEATTTITAPKEVVDGVFVLTMRSYSADLELVTWVDIVDDEYLIEWGNLFCFQMGEHGGVWEDAVLYAIEAGFEAYGDAWNEDDTTMVAFGSGAAIASYCPQYEVPDENPWTA